MSLTVLKGSAISVMVLGNNVGEITLPYKQLTYSVLSKLSKFVEKFTVFSSHGAFGDAATQWVHDMNSFHMSNNMDYGFNRVPIDGIISSFEDNAIDILICFPGGRSTKLEEQYKEIVPWGQVYDVHSRHPEFDWQQNMYQKDLDLVSNWNKSTTWSNPYVNISAPNPNNAPPIYTIDPVQQLEIDLKMAKEMMMEKLPDKVLKSYEKVVNSYTNDDLMKMLKDRDK